MYTTTTQDGLLNNYAAEPKLYYAVYPSPEQQRQYVQQAALAALLVGLTILIAAVVS
jgi:hypothetical protein